MKATRLLVAILSLVIVSACNATDLTGPGDDVRAENTEVMGSPG